MNSALGFERLGALIGRVLFGVFTLGVIGAVVVGGANTAHAITCDYSNNGSGDYKSKMGYSGKLRYDNGSCVLDKPDTANGGVRPNVDNSCPSSKPMLWEGQCYQSRAEYTNLKPTNEDGTAIPDSTWNAICGQTSSDSWLHVTGGFNYDSSRHRCNSGLGCAGNDMDSISGDCRAIGRDTPNPGDVKYEDSTKEKVQQCKSAGATWNGQTHKCNWTDSTCKKAGGTFDAGTANCDIAAAPPTQACDGQGGGQPDKDGKCPDGAKPGEATGAAKDDIKGRCGKVQVNLLDCGENTKEGTPVINAVLRIGVDVLSVVVGIAAVGGLAWAAILYTKAGDNESNVAEAKDLIRNVVIGLFVYVFMIALINFLVPGGVITSPPAPAKSPSPDASSV